MSIPIKGLALACAALVSFGAQAHTAAGEGDSGHAHLGDVCSPDVTHDHSAHDHAEHDQHDHAAHAHDAANAHANHAVRSFPDPASVPAPEGVTVSQCWIRALPNRLPAAGYFKLHNAGSADAVLVGAQARGFGRVMLHTHETRGELSVMTHVDTVRVPAGGGFEFAPGGHHVMLEQADFDLKPGTRHPVVLWFEGDRALQVGCDVRPPGAR
ncbi:copper chaperone PCu(A)C [Yanghanlia caeni]|uniref:Copper chaperone PCu(A)C n=1 Tax=Yanghanlia caeni TaxID=3064283 RepID=A0ABU1D5G7_9BURK|nr:copper chaperone PCu(A)C [Alcaligenaceae bacterium LG-2]NGR08918.1 copper chaperone PCu(A)C [bacterium SGD-2]HZH56206.1 copper chaperone PCu(A)C [Burkholderiaceae bacterium]